MVEPREPISILLVAGVVGALVLTVSATLYTVGGTEQNQVYLVPQLREAICGETVTIDLWIDAEDYQGGQINLTYDSRCITVTNWERNSSNFPMGGWYSDVKGQEWITLLRNSSVTGEYHGGTVTVTCSGEVACTSHLSFAVPSALFGPEGNEIEVTWQNGTVPCLSPGAFDTGTGGYPSIPGTHTGTLKPSQTIVVSSLYTYALPGTGGHTEYVRIWNTTEEVNATWSGYGNDWQDVTFDPIVLYENETYNYTIRTGSYPQIHLTQVLVVPDGEIECTNFTDINGKIFTDRIPAFRLA